MWEFHKKTEKLRHLLTNIKIGHFSIYFQSNTFSISLLNLISLRYVLYEGTIIWFKKDKSFQINQPRLSLD